MSSALANGLAGAGGGIIAQIITYPLQTVNTRQQTERVAKKGGNLLVSDASARTQTHRGTLLQILQVIRSEGWGGLYSGLKPSLFGTAASQGIYYYFYQVFKNKAEAIAVSRKKKGVGDGTVGMLSWLVVAAIAGSLNVLLTIPIWVLVTRMQAKEVYCEAGIAGFWKGIIPTLIMVCNPSIQFMIYETSLKRLRAKRAVNRHGLKNVTSLEVFLLGAVAKLGATVSTYPLLVVKSRLQAKQEIGGNIALRYTGTLDAIIKMIRYEGLRGFYKGMSTKIVQSVFAASVLFMIKEELVKAYLVLAHGSRTLLSTLVK
ncbi:peroxisomal nicotinamide adenine dinucleotide carrier-like isoform X2 [Tasmannia lanceolata]|uniref:peroxisomal nicotinamide adenine dinucleotide carrier-like isoform X2 n=1 Tax=Tasmannia lanceolata TaxID=3420 RepID=UPI004064BF00